MSYQGITGLHTALVNGYVYIYRLPAFAYLVLAFVKFFQRVFFLQLKTGQQAVIVTACLFFGAADFTTQAHIHPATHFFSKWF